ncbi:MAG: hypothetical protein ACFCVH_15285 [Alphaproteobacteria bacterium]
MSNLESLRAKLSEINRKSEAITAGAAAMDRALNDEERARLDSLAQEFQAIQSDIARLETIERQKASVAGPAPDRPGTYTAGPGAASSAASGAAFGDVDPAGVKRAETMLLALGIILAVFAVLSIASSDVVGFVIQGGVSLLTFLIGYKALKDGNIRTARTFSLTMGWIYAGLQILFLIIMLAAFGSVLGPIFWIVWIIGWLFAWGYFYSYQCVTPKAQRKMGL